CRRREESRDNSTALGLSPRNLRCRATESQVFGPGTAKPNLNELPTLRQEALLLRFPPLGPSWRTARSSAPSARLVQTQTRNFRTNPEHRGFTGLILLADYWRLACLTLTQSAVVSTG